MCKSEQNDRILYFDVVSWLHVINSHQNGCSLEGKASRVQYKYSYKICNKLMFALSVYRYYIDGFMKYFTIT